MVELMLKMARALCGESPPGALPRKLMPLVIEHTGAARAVLVLKRPEGLFIQAEGSADGPLVEGVPVPVESSTGLPASLIHHVARTGETVLLHGAATGAPFSEDPYLRGTRPGAVLCGPLRVEEGASLGVLYLENGATRGAFTLEQQEALRLLSLQAAICLEGAARYAGLERQVEEHTSELQRKDAELAELRTRLEELQRQLVEQEKLASLGSLTAGIAHELQNPLNFVNNFSELSTRLTGELEESLRGMTGPLDGRALEDVLELLEDLRQNSQRIHTHGRRASDIIKAMLRHSRRSEGTRSKADLNVLVRDSVSLAVQGLRSKPGGASVRTETQLDPAVGVVEVVASDISRLLINILDNAFYAVTQKHAQGGAAPCVQVSTRRQGDTVELRVRDNGGGIPEHVREKLFHPFFTTKPAGVGTGLGLSLCRDIVQEHQGEIRVESQPGEYTEFIITLPAPPASSAAA